MDSFFPQRNSRNEYYFSSNFLQLFLRASQAATDRFEGYEKVLLSVAYTLCIMYF